MNESSPFYDKRIKSRFWGDFSNQSINRRLSLYLHLNSIEGRVSLFLLLPGSKTNSSSGSKTNSSSGRRPSFFRLLSDY